MVMPAMLVTTSPGFVAVPLGRFSQAATMPTTFRRGFSSAMALIVPSTLAAPHMSNFISSMPAPGLMEMPPESKVMPLPTSTCGRAPFAPPRYSSTISFAGSLLPAVTESRAPIFSSAIFFSSNTLHCRRGCCAASARALAARCDGVQMFAGRLPSSRARFAPAAIARPSPSERKVAAAGLAALPSTTLRSRGPGSGFDSVCV